MHAHLVLLQVRSGGHVAAGVGCREHCVSATGVLCNGDAFAVMQDSLAAEALTAQFSTAKSSTKSLGQTQRYCSQFAVKMNA